MYNSQYDLQHLFWCLLTEELPYIMSIKVNKRTTVPNARSFQRFLTCHRKIQRNSIVREPSFDVLRLPCHSTFQGNDSRRKKHKKFDLGIINLRVSRGCIGSRVFLQLKRTPGSRMLVSRRSSRGHEYFSVDKTDNISRVIVYGES